MIAYQLDKNSDSKKLARRCIDEGIVNLYRFHALGLPDTATDPEVFAACQPLGRVLLTFDGRFADQHAQQLSEQHHGIVIVGNDCQKHFTVSDGMTTLARLKSFFDQWGDIAPLNSVVHITEAWVQVCRIERGKVKVQQHLPYTNDGWQESLDRELIDNGALRRPRRALADFPREADQEPDCPT
ncbi:MAG: hypothetical protein DCC68_06000 [Planctomycetota bacterium]|nr:MAG: hypothetical protein DCC68_06000 [Planctomycetota bacterium]